MSTRLLVSDLQDDRQFRICTALNICPDDDRFFAWLNLAEDLMLNQGRFLGSIVEAQFCVRDGCLTFPRQVAAVEQIAVNGQPLDIENGFYGFTRLLANLRPCAGCGSASNAIPSGTSARRCACGHWQMRMKEGTVASFATTRTNGSVLRVYPTNSSDIGKTLIVQGNDSNGIWVRTAIDGVVQDGERVTLALPYVDTVTTWGVGAPVAVVKDTTNYRVLLYEVAGGSERLLANYEPSETRPTYKQGWIPGLRSGGCSSSALTTVQAMVSLQHIALTQSSDWLVLQNPAAYKAAMMAVKAWEEGNVASGNYYFYGTQASGRNARGVERVVNRGGAIPLLVAELRKQTGDRTNVYVYHDESNKFVGTMMNFI